MSLKSYTPINVMTTLYDQVVDSRYRDKNMFPDSKWREQGIYFCVKVSSHCFGFEKDGNTHHPEWVGNAVAWFHVLMINGHSVFTQTTRDFQMSIPTEGWKNESNHDSCYRESLGELTTLGFDIHDEAFANMPKDKRVEYGITRDDYTDFDFDSGFGRIFRFVDVKLKPREDNDYFYDVLSVKPREYPTEQNEVAVNG